MSAKAKKYSLSMEIFYFFKKESFHSNLWSVKTGCIIALFVLGSIKLIAQSNCDPTMDFTVIANNGVDINNIRYDGGRYTSNVCDFGNNNFHYEYHHEDFYECGSSGEPNCGSWNLTVPEAATNIVEDGGRIEITWDYDFLLNHDHVTDPIILTYNYDYCEYFVDIRPSDMGGTINGPDDYTSTDQEYYFEQEPSTDKKIEWYLDGQYIGDSNPINLNASPEDNGDRILKAEVSNYCGNSATFDKEIHIDFPACEDYSVRVAWDTNGDTLGGSAVISTLIATNCSPNYYWNMGDGTTYSTRSIRHLYDSPGKYDVTIAVEYDCNDYCGVRRDTLYTEWTYGCESVSPEFTTNEIGSGAIEFSTNLENPYNCSILNYHWDFGNGNISSLQNPTHKFCSTGSHLVSLTVTFDCGDLCDQKTQTVSRNITVNSAPILSTNITEAINNNSVDFSPDISNPNGCTINSHYWDFGDGTVSYLQSPTHEYCETGNYDVSLTTNYNCGCGNENITTTKQININNLSVAASISETISLNTVDFSSDISNPSFTPSIADPPNECTIEGYNWDFGDGVTSTASNPVHNYCAVGNYNVELIVEYNCGNGCGTKSVSVSKSIVIEEIKSISADYTFNKSKNTIDFTSSIANPNGCTIEGYNWDFGDGNFSTDSNPIHKFCSTGTFDVTLTVKYDCGGKCGELSNATITKSIIIDQLKGIELDFKYYINQCGVYFNPVIEGLQDDCNIQSYSWEFGDGSISGQREPYHSYASTGTYDVSLTIDYSCNDESDIASFSTSQMVDLSEDPFDSLTIEVGTNIIEDVLSASATTFSDTWRIGIDDEGLANKHSYATGESGVWRNNGSYVYQTNREATDPSPDISKDGTFTLETFNWANAEHEAIPGWLRTNNVTRYSPFSYELENKDVLGNPSSAIYGYGGHMPVAVGQNMKHQEMAFTGFEELNSDGFAIVDNISNNTTGNWTITEGATAASSREFEIETGYGNMAYIKRPIEDFEGIDTVTVEHKDVIKLGSFFIIGDLFISFKVHKDVAILCKETTGEYDQHTKITFDHVIDDEYWYGNMWYNDPGDPGTVADISTTVAHTGTKSLAISSDKTIRQNDLQLQGGKEYLLSAWLSINDKNLVTPVLGSNLGIRVSYYDEDDVQLGDTLLMPNGNIIEGWQKLEGKFTYPEEASSIELTFTPGTSTTLYIDDLKLHPVDGNMQSYVYELDTYRLRAVIDENNYASKYFYDAEGNLYLVKKETEKGIRTIQESVSYQVKNEEE